MLCGVLPMAVAGDAGGAQLQGIAYLQGGYQQEALFAFLLDLHIAAPQQDLQRLRAVMPALHALGGLALQAAGVERQVQTPLARQLVQRGGQRAGRDVPVALLALAGGRGDGDCRQHACAGHAQAEGGSVDGMAQGGADAHPIACAVVDAHRQATGDQQQDLVGVGQLVGAGDLQPGHLRRAAQHAGAVARQLVDELAQGHLLHAEHAVGPGPGVAMHGGRPIVALGEHLQHLARLDRMRGAGGGEQRHLASAHGQQQALGVLAQQQLAALGAEGANRGVDAERAVVVDVAVQADFTTEQGQPALVGAVAQVDGSGGVQVDQAAVAAEQFTALAGGGAAVGHPGRQAQRFTCRPASASAKGQY
ncbi:hypothetical protein WR25_07181 [Diploscapter pachys]|uniref:Uncharacterized protein n=1 Tax=Diploscapter pachys TaxID=2018661 RepID=A0A2A2KBM2_9BILA|nr:hypothetical protein WR25_07181 [Diploscapter pachys]